MAYVVLLGDEVHNFMRGLQLEILEEFGVNLGLSAPPHVTLKLGFFAPDVRPFARHVADLALSIRPFTLRFNGIGFFPEGFAYLGVDHDGELEALRRQVVAQVNDRFGVEPYALERGTDYKLHATLAHGLTRAEFEAVQKRLRDVRVDLSCPVTHLALIFRWTERWVTFHRAALAGESSTSPDLRPGVVGVS